MMMVSILVVVVVAVMVVMICMYVPVVHIYGVGIGWLRDALLPIKPGRHGDAYWMVLSWRGSILLFFFFSLFTLAHTHATNFLSFGALTGVFFHNAFLFLNVFVFVCLLLLLLLLLDGSDRIDNAMCIPYLIVRFFCADDGYQIKPQSDNNNNNNNINTHHHHQPPHHNISQSQVPILARQVALAVGPFCASLFGLQSPPLLLVCFFVCSCLHVCSMHRFGKGEKRKNSL
jgi:hypothetical protein